MKDSSRTDAEEQNAVHRVSLNAISRRRDAARIPLSFSQRQLWFVQQMLPDTPAYNVPSAIRLNCEIDGAVLQKAANEVIYRDEALRTRFEVSEGEPVQVVEPELHVNLTLEDISGVSPDERLHVLRRRVSEESQKPFNLEQLPLIRLYLFKLGPADHVYLTVLHHILVDGWSLDVYYRELESLYTAYLRSEKSPLPELPLQYGDYACWQAELFRQGELEKGIDYWKGQLTGVPHILDLPADYSRAITPKFEGASTLFTIDGPIAQSLKVLSRKSGTTLYMTLMAAFALFLQRYTRQEQILIGTPIANRPLEEMQELIGFFANTLALPVDLRGNVTFTELLKRVRKSALGGYEHQHIPFELLVERIKPERSLNRTPLFQVMFVMQGSANASHNKFLGGEAFKFDLPVAKFDLSLSMREQEDRLLAELNYDTSLFAPQTIRRFQDNFVFLLEELSKDSRLRPSDVNGTLTPGEWNEIRQYNSTKVNREKNECLHTLFEKQVAATPDRIALIDDQEKLTYLELNRRSNQLAHYLQKNGIQAETCVGVCMERSWEMVVALLGILKAGAAYLPFDPEYPLERLRWMQNDARVTTVLTQKRHVHCFHANEGTSVVALDSSWNLVAQEPDDGCTTAINPENVAYVIYTSGSTGRPKGVMNRHAGICNRLLWMQDAYGLNESDRILQKTPYSFDVSVWEFFWPLITGAALVMARPGGHRDSSYLKEVIQKERITTLHFVPSMLKSMLDDGGLKDCKSLRRVICSGEALSTSLKDQFYRQCSAGLHNLYGPTEAAVDVTSWECERETLRPVVPIGRPISNTEIYIVDENLMQVPVLATGELCIGGEGLSRGYLNSPELTAEKFIPNPFGGSGSRLYRTGDLARFLNDGAIEYLGRMDYQVKIRGNRIELGEIEEVLKQHQSVQDAVVTMHEDQLSAYLVAKSVDKIKIQDLRIYLKSRLPDFMVPSAFVVIEKLPLSANGKLDRKALSGLESVQPEERQDIAPRNGLEEKIAQIWAKVLRLERVGINSNFFDLGGHSLRLMQVHSELKQTLQIDIPVIELFRLPTIASIANYLSAVKEVKNASQPAVDLQNSSHDDSIAVIGLAGRFPQARNVEEFWENLKYGVESVSFFTDEELSDVPASLRRDPNYVKAAAVLEEPDFFDADFFGFRQREAESTDPQQRIFLECAWEVLERAGYDVERYSESIGVFAGMATSGYWSNLCRSSEILESVNSFQLAIGNEKDHLPLRVSYKLNLKGPSVSVQTACSTSLVAVHMACQSLMAGECKMAMAGGVSVRAVQKTGYIYQEGGITSPDGHCRTFDADAAGTISGNGAGIVLLKKLQDAIADGDHIHAIIRGSAINNDGAFKVGYTAPSINGQADVVVRAQAKAKVPVETITYVEAHGTATPLGDPIEISALTQAFRLQTSKTQFCAIGSVKTNVGHLDAAAGITGFIKTVLALEHGWIPPSLHFKSPNPRIDFSNSPFYVNSKLQKWEPDAGLRRAAVSSFGIGGTNAHVILEEAAPQEAGRNELHPQLLLLSCRTDSALQQATLHLEEHLRNHPTQNIRDVAYTLQDGRKEFAFRRAIICENNVDAHNLMKPASAKRVITGKAETISGPLYFLFPGQGAQYVNMARELYQSIPVFRQEVDRCSGILRTSMGFQLEDLLFPTGSTLEDSEKKLQQTANAQPALFVIEYALASLWIKLGIRPTAMLGHSLGEYVAACLADVFSLEDALRLVAVRGELMQNMPPGAMLTVLAPYRQVEELLVQHRDLALAAINGPDLFVLSGKEKSIMRVEAQLAEQEIETRRLRTSHAFHSVMMKPVAASLRHVFNGIKFNNPRIPFLSNLTGEWIKPEEAINPEYWVRHLLETVRFSDNLKNLFTVPNATLLEMGPSTLITLAKRHSGYRAEMRLISSLPSKAGKDSEYLSLLHAVGCLWVEGRKIQWHFLPRDGQCRRVVLPTYPFERQQYNIPAQPRQSQTLTGNGTIEHPGFPQKIIQDQSTNAMPSPVARVSARQVVLQQLDVVASQLEFLSQRIH